VLKFCKDANHMDILIPNMQFYMKFYEEYLLPLTQDITKEFLWEDRNATLFGCFASYQRVVGKGVSTNSKGYHGAKSCFRPNLCKTLDHFIFVEHNITLLSGVAVNIAHHPRVSMMDHSKFKYLIHLDAAAWSSRPDQLLPLGAGVFKEASGY
jgi:hypothetical protein